ncbi:MAG: hypothetical protein IM624_03895 [Phenylobacterium sp.]|uniref:hypothetical protein n=1 Tax=Phenylobacterium sp. TaxID=1871053 RepID=UPI0025DE6E02|nr:hypothetical protein [Phenylobacterium sp.]MCA6298324.1 hypothetical protein [Phenylobacterium sp.]
MNKILAAAVAASLSNALPAHAQRAESIIQTSVAVRDSCAFTKYPTAATEEALVESILGGLFANVGGDLAGSAIESAAQAIAAASREQAFIAEGTASYAFFKLKDPTDERLTQPEQKEKCVTIWRSGTGASADGRTGFSAFAFLNGGDYKDPTYKRYLLADDEGSANLLSELGITGSIDLYVEIWIVPAADGMIVAPTMVWYPAALPGAPRRTASAAELQVQFATPASGPNTTDLGSSFAIARIALPKLAPGAKFVGPDLASFRSPVVPARTPQGSAADRATALNAAEAAYVTARATERASLRARDAAKRKADRARAADQKVPGNRTALEQAEDALQAANEKLADDQEATTLAMKRRSRGNLVALGSTNLRARFAVIRDENKFGMAIAKALTARKDDLDTKLSAALAPKDDWSPSLTALLEAESEVNSKQRLYDAAIAEGRLSDAPALADQLRIAKAKANEKAIAAGRSIPHPGLLKP